MEGAINNQEVGNSVGPSRPGRSFHTPPWLGLVVLAAIVGAVVGTAATTALGGHGTKTVIEQPAAIASGSTSPGIADLYAGTRPSVVRIESVSTSSGQGGTGSGLVLDKQGDIATNYHVINGFNQLDAKLSDGTDVAAQVVGTDPGDDLAIIRVSVDPSKLTPVTLGDSSSVRVGDGVMAIGNPLDLEATLSEGVVSGLGRVLASSDSRPQSELIQTDAAINPGNSGGGLFNLNGQLIGITNAIENPSGADTFAGIGYAIPVNTLKQYESDMLAGNTIMHAKLGASLQDVTPAIASAFNLKVQQGVLVGSVDANSGASKAGLRGGTRTQPGDVIVSIDGHNITTFNDIAAYLDTKKPGDTVQLKVDRSGSDTTLNVTLDAWSTN